MSDITFNQVTDVNAKRANRWHPGFPNDGDWSGADWSNAMQGEAGEAGNVVKKLRRIETGIHSENNPPKEELLKKLGKEIGDTYIYLDLLATYYGLDIQTCVVEAFNEVSRREGFPERLGEASELESRRSL